MKTPDKTTLGTFGPKDETYLSDKAPGDINILRTNAQELKQPEIEKSII